MKKCPCFKVMEVHDKMCKLHAYSELNQILRNKFLIVQSVTSLCMYSLCMLSNIT